MAVVGYATVALIPSMEGFTEKVKSQLTGVDEAISKTGVNGAGSAGSKAGGNFMSKFSAGIQSGSGKLTSGFSGILTGMLASQAIYGAATAVGQGIMSAIKAGIQSAGSLQNDQISLTALLGSAQAGSKMTSDLVKFADSTSFDTDNLMQTAKALLGTGVAAKDIIPDLTALGNGMATFGNSTADQNTAMLGFSQILARGTFDLQDFRQVQMAIPSASQELAKALDVPVSSINDMISSGKLAASDVMPKFLAQLSKDYSGSITKQAGTVTGAFANMADTLKTKLGEDALPILSKITPYVGPFTDGLGKIIDGAAKLGGVAFDGIKGFFDGLGQHKAAIKEVSDAFGKLVSSNVSGFAGALKAAGDAIGSVFDFATAHKNGVKALLEAVGDVTAAFIGFTVVEALANALNPFGLILIALTAVTAGVIYVNKVVQDKFGGWRNLFKDIGGWFKDVWNDIAGWFSGLWSKVTGGVRSAWSGITGFFSGLWGGIKNGAVSAWNGTISWLRGVPGKIAGAIGDLGSLLWNAGSSIMGGFLKGLEAGYEKVKSLVGGVAQWIKDHKGPVSYDAVLLTPAGQAIMQGLNAGILSQMPQLQTTVNTVTATVAGVGAPVLAQPRVTAGGLMGAATATPSPANVTPLTLDRDGSLAFFRDLADGRVHVALYNESQRQAAGYR